MPVIKMFSEGTGASGGAGGMHPGGGGGGGGLGGPVGATGGPGRSPALEHFDTCTQAGCPRCADLGIREVGPAERAPDHPTPEEVRRFIRAAALDEGPNCTEDWFARVAHCLQDAAGMPREPW